MVARGGYEVAKREQCAVWFGRFSLPFCGDGDFAVGAVNLDDVACGASRIEGLGGLDTHGGVGGEARKERVGVGAQPGGLGIVGLDFPCVVEIGPVDKRNQIGDRNHWQTAKSDKRRCGRAIVGSDLEATRGVGLWLRLVGMAGTCGILGGVDFGDEGVALFGVEEPCGDNRVYGSVADMNYCVFGIERGDFNGGVKL